MTEVHPPPPEHKLLIAALLRCCEASWVVKKLKMINLHQVSYSIIIMFCAFVVLLQLAKPILKWFKLDGRSDMIQFKYTNPLALVQTF